MVANLFTPPALPAVLEGLSKDIADIRESNLRIANAIAQEPGPPDAEMIAISLDSASIPNNWYATSDQLRVVAIDFWTDTNGKWWLQVENDRWGFRTNSNLKQRVIDPPGTITIPRGMRVGFTLDGQAPFEEGAAVWSAILYARPGTARGKQGPG